MNNVYVLTKIDHTDRIVVGVFAAHRLAEIARDQLVASLTEDQYDTGIFYCITAFEMGKVY